MIDPIMVRHNPEAERFEVELNGRLAVLEYRQYPGKLMLDHTEVPSEYSGQGIGSALAKTALEYARTEGLVVAPLCSFVANYITEHPEYQDLVQKKNN